AIRAPLRSGRFGTSEVSVISMKRREMTYRLASIAVLVLLIGHAILAGPTLGTDDPPASGAKPDAPSFPPSETVEPTPSETVEPAPGPLPTDPSPTVSEPPSKPPSATPTSPSETHS